MFVYFFSLLLLPWNWKKYRDALKKFEKIRKSALGENIKGTKTRNKSRTQQRNLRRGERNMWKLIANQLNVMWKLNSFKRKRSEKEKKSPWELTWRGHFTIVYMVMLQITFYFYRCLKKLFLVAYQTFFWRIDEKNFRLQIIDVLNNFSVTNDAEWRCEVEYQVKNTQHNKRDKREKIFFWWKEMKTVEIMNQKKKKRNVFITI